MNRDCALKASVAAHYLEDSDTHALKTKGAPHARVTCTATTTAAVKCVELLPKSLYELSLDDLLVSTMMGSPRDSSIVGANEESVQSGERI